ncbi:MAG: response regulator [Vicinamibacterales bacterium]
MSHQSTLLLVDDDPNGLDLLVSLLRPLGHVLTAVNGRDALMLAQTREPDLVVLDVMMPELDGYEVCRRIRATPRLAEVPVLLLTALDDREARLEGLDAGADGFISKPYDRMELRTRIKTILRLNRYRGLHTARRQADAIVQSAPHGIAITREDGQLLMVNQTVGALMGLAPGEESAVATLTDLVGEAATRQAMSLIALAQADGEHAHRLELTLRQAGGTMLPVEIVARSLPWDERPAVQLVLHDVTERRAAAHRIEGQLRRLAMLRDIDITVSSSTDRETVFNLVLHHLRSGAFVDAAAIFLVNRHTGTLERVTHDGFRTAPPLPCDADERLDLGQIITLVTPEATALRVQALANEDFVDANIVPLIAGAQVVGLLEVYRRTPQHVEAEWVDFLASVASSLALAVEKTELIEHLRRTNQELSEAYDRTLEGWVLALDLRDKETEGHTQRVTRLTVELARSTGMGGTPLEHLRRGALLHDIGKIGIPDRILLKPGKLDPDERAHMEKHPVYAYQMLSPIAYLEPALDIPYCHHEKWDGTGYPRGLKGTAIPIAARLFAVVDVWDALTSDRPYRAALPHDQVVEMIRAGSGTHFDPEVVEAFLALVEAVRANAAA